MALALRIALAPAFPGVGFGRALAVGQRLLARQWRRVDALGQARLARALGDVPATGGTPGALWQPARGRELRAAARCLASD